MPDLRQRFFLMLVVCSLAPAAEPPRTVILVRHAERAAGMAPDVGISEAGECRARVLADMLADAGLKHIYTSEVARTQQTAEPLAKKLGLRPEVIGAKDYDTLLPKLRSGVAGGAVLVVGHSNTVPEIIARLGGGSVPEIPDDEFSRLFVVTITGKKQASVVILHYQGCSRSQ
jgi:phosphohistidine phosphatase SixA